MNQAYGDTKMARRLVWVAAICNVAGFVLWCPLASKSAGVMVLMLLLALVANSAVGAYAVQQGLIFEWLLERRFKAVCQAIGFVGEGRLQFKPRVAFDPISSFQKGHWERKTIYPKLREIYGKHDSWRGAITPFVGQTLEQYNDAAPAFALAFNAEFLGFDKTADGKLRIRVGAIPIPSQYDFQE